MADYGERGQRARRRTHPCADPPPPGYNRPLSVRPKEFFLNVRGTSPYVIAHRGASGRAPENTLEAMRLALEEDGAEGLELDLQMSADGEVVVLHDETVDRTTDGRGATRTMSLAELRALDAGARFRDERGNTPFAGRGLRIPTFREVLERFPGTWMSLDLKEGGPDLESAALALVRAFAAEANVVLSAENPASARRLARLAPEVPRFFDRAAARAFYVRHRLRLWWGYRPPASSLQIPVRHGRWRLDTPRLLHDARRHGLVVRYWTINRVDEMERLIDLGADGIITDHPARLRKLLEQRGLR